MKKLIPFLIVFLIVFYILPLIIKTSIILLAVSPIFILITAFVYGVKFGFNILLATFCAILYIPFLITSGLISGVYLIAFFVCSIIGNLLGLLFRKN